MDWRGRIAIDPEVLGGKPVVKGTRIAVELVVGLLGRGTFIVNRRGFVRDAT